MTHITGITLTESAECPCCKGKKILRVVHHDEALGRTTLTSHTCTHCQGEGTIKIERPVRYEPKKYS
jgi:DnaJ-class molecular chaperone